MGHIRVDHKFEGKEGCLRTLAKLKELVLTRVNGKRKSTTREYVHGSCSVSCAFKGQGQFGQNHFCQFSELPYFIDRMV